MDETYSISNSPDSSSASISCSMAAGRAPPWMRTPNSIFRSNAASVRLALVRNAVRESATARFRMHHARATSIITKPPLMCGHQERQAFAATIAPS
jgi:hypothetical protein